jgi:hypothetical protein
MHVYTFFTLYSPSYPLSPTPPSSHWCLLCPLDRTYFALLFFDFAEEKREKEKHNIFACFR